MTPAAPPPPRAGRVVAVVLVAAASLGAGVALRAVLVDPGVPLLPPSPGARWIVYPHVPRAGIRPAVELATTFRRDFVLASRPERATLALRALRGAEVEINGRPVASLDGANWKRARRVDVTGALRAGENTIVARVRYDHGPPALWLRLDAGPVAVASGATFESSLAGAEARHARLAGAPVDPAPLDPDGVASSPVRGLRARAPVLAVLAVLAGLAVAAGGRVAVLAGRDPGRFRWLRGAAPVAAALAWCVLFVNNAPSLSMLDGYDAAGHVEYIRYVLEHHAVPPADLGWSTFQPPLYYVTAAAALALAGVGTADFASGYVLRLLGLSLGLVQLVLLWAAARIVFGGRAGPAAVALLAGACLPVQLYQFQLVGNDAMAATLCTAALWLTLHLLHGGANRVESPVQVLDKARVVTPAANGGSPDGSSSDQHAGSASGVHTVRTTMTTMGTGVAGSTALGVLLGAAMLAKASALPVVGVVLAALSVRLAARRADAVAWLRTAGVAVAAMLATCGWHYLGMARRFGSPLAGNWDARVMPAWWQDPGVATAVEWLRFGDALRAPVYAALRGVWDGLYSTLWGDGLLAGRVQRWFAPPWDAPLVDAGYVLAVVPTVLIGVGIVAFAGRAARRRDGVAATVLAVGGVTLLALVAWPARLPMYSVVKATFGLPAVLPLAVLVAAGWEAVRVRAPRLGAVALALLSVWAASAWLSHWIPRGAPGVLARLAWVEASTPGREALGEAHAHAALARDPGNAVARMALARVDIRGGRGDRAVAALRGVLGAEPDRAQALLDLGRVLTRLGRRAEAGPVFEALVRLRPDQAEARAALGRLSLEAGRPHEAVAQLRRALAAVPEAPAVHADLADALDALGEVRAAREHRRQAAALSSPAVRKDGTR